MQAGFTFPVMSLKSRKTIDCFCVTNRVKKTKELYKAVIKALNNIGYDLPENEEIYSDLSYYMRRSVLTEHLPNTESFYYSIDGKGFSCGGAPENVLIIQLDK